MNRREFLKGTAWMGAAAFAAGCQLNRFGFGDGGKMATYADKPFKKLRVGIVGLGRGQAGVNGFNAIPGCEITAICDLDAIRIRYTLERCAEAKRPAPKVYTGSEEAWKKLCDDPNVDLVYNATPWQLHVPIALYAMNAGKHVATEVPSAFTVDQCWELVETSERLGRHCMQLENCCYGENEMLALNLCKQGILGEIVHAEGAYIHDLRVYNYGDWDANRKVAGDKVTPAEAWAKDKDGYDNYWNYWRLRHNKDHKGNQYPTHGLGPICWYMDINRGDRFDYLVSLESDQFNFTSFAKAHYPADSWKAKLKVEMGDMNTLLIKTKLGRSIMIQHDVSSPRPYSRINRVTGTAGAFEGIQFLDKTGKDAYSTPWQSGCFCRFAWEEKPGEGAHTYFDEKKTEEMREKYKHPLYQAAGAIAQKMGGHGGMDFMMVLRLAYCLQNGLPLDQNVYDLASWCSLCELSEKSVRARSASVDIPDFTRGAWKTTPKLDLRFDMDKLGV